LLYHITVLIALATAQGLGNGLQQISGVFLKEIEDEDPLDIGDSIVILFVIPVCFLALASCVDVMFDVCLDCLSMPILLQLRTGLFELGVPNKVVNNSISIGMLALPTMGFVWAAIAQGGFQDWSRLFHGAVYGNLVFAVCIFICMFVVRVKRIFVGQIDADLDDPNFDDLFSYLIHDDPPEQDEPESTLLQGPQSETRIAMDMVVLVRGTWNSEQGFPKKYMLWGTCFLGIAFIGALIFWGVSFIPSVDTKVEFQIGIVWILVLLAAARLAQYLMECQVFGCGQGFFLVFLCTLVAVFFAAKDVDNSEDMQFDLEPPHPGTNYSAQLSNGHYTMCDTTFGSPNHTLHQDRLAPLDLAVFAASVYEKDKRLRMEYVMSATNGTDLEGVSMETQEDESFVGAWTVYRLDSVKVWVIAVRGTQLGLDIIADVSLFGSLVIMQAFSTLIPLFTFVPADLIALGAQALQSFGFFSYSHVYKPIVQRTFELKEESDKMGYQLILTGHSLGGSLAAVAGASAKVPAVTFSAPGTKYTFDGTDVEAGSFGKSQLNVQPADDPVPNVDFQTGMNQPIQCSTFFINCHSIVQTICNIYRSCGDPRGRVYRWSAHLNTC
jgi:hypothetical protein